MSQNPAGPGSGTPGGCCQSGGPASMERVRYFARQLITPDDLTQEQDYFRAKLRRHNRLLHGWGVVCGLEVRPSSEDWTVCVAPGYALGPQGDEILVDGCVKVDVSRQGLDGNAATSCPDEVDPWCSGVRADRRAGDVVYLAVAYAECPARPVRVQPAGCGCDGVQCEYSRLRDGYVLRVLTPEQLPPAYTNQIPPPRSPFQCPPSGVRECPECISDPWVVLASITINGKSSPSWTIDNFTYRRYVATFAGWWFTCPGPSPSPSPSPSPTPPPALLRVGDVRGFADQGDIVLDLKTDGIDLTKLVFFPANTAGIEFEFADAPVDFGSIVADQTIFLVNAAGARVSPMGRIVNMPGNTIRWFPNSGVIQGNVDYQIILVGTGGQRIVSQQGSPLDGEPTGFPSGDGQAGGDFRFQFRFELIG